MALSPVAEELSGGPPPKFLSSSEEEGDTSGEEGEGEEVEDGSDVVGEVGEEDGGSGVAGEEEEALSESVGDVGEVKLEVKDEPLTGDYEVGYSCFPYSVLLHSFPPVSGS